MVPVVKIVAILGILVLTLLCSSIPTIMLYCLGSTRVRPKSWFYYLLLFSCMLIASTGINHVLPNAVDAFDLFKSGWGYPYPGIICTATILLSWALDMLMDPRKATVQVAYSAMIVDTDDDLPPVDPYLFTAAIYVHSILEGLVLGAAPIDGSDSKMFYTVLAVLAFHKCVEGFSLAVVYEAYEYSKWSKILLLIAYSLLTPGGILVGMILTLALSGVTSLIAGVCSAISAGIFIYAGISIMVGRIIPAYARTNWRYMFAFLGWGISSAIAWFA